MMNKQERQDAILELISKTAVSKQDELARLLRNRGFAVTQASVSRDLDELGVVKLDGRYGLPPPLSERPGRASISIAAAGDNLVVVKCAAGLASAYAVRIDGARIPEIVGTIAGDDTIFIAVADIEARQSAVKKIRALFEQQETG